MTTELANPIDPGMLEKVVIGGDLATLSPAQRLDYYARVCESVGINPLTKPFQYIKFQGGLTLYAGRNCTDQLAKGHKISLSVDDGREVQGVWVVRATASDDTGRKADAVGAVSLNGLKGEALANGLMKAETKAKRRAVLSFTGLSFLDETEVETIPDAEKFDALEAPSKGFKPWEEWAMTVEAETAEDFNAVLDSIKDDPRPRKVALVHEARARGFDYSYEELRFFDRPSADETAIDIPEDSGE